ncbi:MAG: ATP-binding cassette domain-containing protein, partial [Bdellovibrionales bacterium]|nr:ATP-binding cassette domain-containing protein [Bdellovibrionales bacterium]
MSPSTEEAKVKELSFGIVFKKLWPFLWSHKKLVLVSTFLVVLYSGIGRLIPLIFGRAIDEVVTKEQMDMLYLLAGVYFAVEVTRTGLSFLQSYQIQKLGNVTLFEIRQKLISHVQRLPLKYFDQNPSGRTVTRVTNDVLALGEIFSQGVAGIMVSLFEMGAIYITMLFLSWKLTLMVSVLVPFLLIFCVAISRKIRFQFGATKRKLSAINAFSAEHITGMKVIQLFGREATITERFQKLSEEYKALQVKTIRYFALLWPSIEGFAIFTISMAIFFGAWFRGDLDLTVGALTAFIILLQNFFRPLRIILEKYNHLQNSLSSADRVFQLLDEVQERESGARWINSVKGHLIFKDLNFSYSENGPKILKNINLEILPGESVALVGRTGSGKSTTISLLQRL